MQAPPLLPMSLQQCVHQQATLPSERLVDPAETRQYPYGTYWWRAIAGILLAGRVKPRHDRAPNMTDVNRLCKEANFNQYLFERVTKFLVNAQIIDVSKGQREYVPGEYTMTFWQRDIPTLQHASRRAFLAFVQQLTGYQAWCPTIAVQSELDVFVTLFAAAVAGLALPVEYRKYKTAFPVVPPPSPSYTRLSPAPPDASPAPGDWPGALPAARRPQDG
jgi:hypothetical protein